MRKDKIGIVCTTEQQSMELKVGARCSFSKRRGWVMISFPCLYPRLSPPIVPGSLGGNQGLAVQNPGCVPGLASRELSSE